MQSLRRLRLSLPSSPLLALAYLAGAALAGEGDRTILPDVGPPLYTGWRTFGVAEGLPSSKVLCVLPDGDDVWVGTEKGLARLRDGVFEVYSTGDGLAHPVVSSLALSEETGDLWVGTFGGLSRWSAGRIDTFRQLGSGLINDVVYAVDVLDGDVWVATASGVNVYHPDERRWDLFNHENTVMHEPWCYGLATSEEKVFIAVWGGGVVEHDLDRGTWKAYRDPDGEMEIDLFRDDGLIHDVTSAVAHADGLLWVGTYFGLSRYDGRSWTSYLEHDTPLPSNFINAVRVSDGWAWIATDDGLAAFDGETWVVYRPGEPEADMAIRVHSEDGYRDVVTTSPLAHRFVLDVAFQGDRLWVATVGGLSVGSRIREPGRRR